jgi:predicted Zn-dependent peptidase
MSFVHHGAHSRFYNKIRNEKSLAYSIEKVNFSFNEVEYIGTEIGVPTNKVDETIEAILESYQELLIKGITKKEIKDKIKTLYFTAKRDNERAADWVDKFDGCLYQEENPVVGDFPDIYNFRETITEKEIKEVLQKYIKLDKFHLFIFGKKSSKKHF